MFCWQLWTHSSESTAPFPMWQYFVFSHLVFLAHISYAILFHKDCFRSKQAFYSVKSGERNDRFLYLSRLKYIVLKFFPPVFFCQKMFWLLRLLNFSTFSLFLLFWILLVYLSSLTILFYLFPGLFLKSYYQIYGTMAVKQSFFFFLSDQKFLNNPSHCWYSDV